MRYKKCASRILSALAGVLIVSTFTNPCYATVLASSDVYVSARFPAGDILTGYSSGRPANPQPYAQAGSNDFQNPDGGDGLPNGFVGVFASGFGAGGLATNHAAKTALDLSSQLLEYSAFSAATGAAAAGASVTAAALSLGYSQELIAQNLLDTELFLALDLTYRFVLFSIHGEGRSTARVDFALEESSDPSDPSVIFGRSFMTSGSAFDSCGVEETEGAFDYLPDSAGLDGGRCQWTIPVWIQLAPGQTGVYRLSAGLVDVAEVPEPTTLFLAGFGLCCMAASFRLRRTRCGMWFVFVTAALAASTARADSPDFVYGRCGGPTTGYAERADLVRRAGRSLDRVVSIDVISCGHTDWTGGVQEVQCPAGLPYSYCLRDRRDGQNNTITVGVIDDATPPAFYLPRSPWAYYSGCGGAQGRLADLLRKLGLRAASAHAIDILECGRSGASQRVGLTPCPKGSTYSYCVLADGDGLGNRIKVGVLDAGADPAGFYGPCTAGATAKRKTDLIWDRGGHAINVWRASVVSCGPGNGATRITSAACPAELSASYCLSTPNDGAGNSVTIAFWERQDDDPFGYVGGTLTTAGYHMRIVYPDNLGGQASNVAAIRTISVSPYDGPGGTQRTACPVGSTYDYCVENQNDGLGNHVILGIWNKKWPSIYDLYGRCRFMADRRGDPLVSRQLEILKAGQKPLHVLGVEVLSCESIGSKFDLNQARVVQCPAGPWSYCIENDNDGAGNKVMLGVVNW